MGVCTFFIHDTVIADHVYCAGCRQAPGTGFGEGVEKKEARMKQPIVVVLVVLIAIIILIQLRLQGLNQRASLLNENPPALNFDAK